MWMHCAHKIHRNTKAVDVIIQPSGKSESQEKKQNGGQELMTINVDFITFLS